MKSITVEDQGVVEISDEQHQNLFVLAVFMEQGGATQYGVEFRMSVFTADGSGVEEERCNTAGCAAGHATWIVPKFYGESYPTYITRTFGGEWGEADAIYDWVFSDDWYGVDDTLEGVAFRIRYMLKHGVPDLAGDKDIVPEDTISEPYDVYIDLKNNWGY